jgi:hypothetical protein
VALVVAVAFFLYWRQSSSAATTSDGASIALQASDMLHGNLLLHGWQLGDVSFYSTELPQYMLIDAVLGLGPWVVHAAAAMTYTLLVFLAALLARGRASGAEGITRALLAAGIIIAPQIGATSTVLLGPAHTGTAVPLLLAWLLIDRAPPRWYVPVGLSLLVAWTLVADSLVLVVAVAPLVTAGVLRAIAAWFSRRPAAWRYELSLAAAAVGAVELAWLARWTIHATGGYTEASVSTRTVTLGQLPRTAWVMCRAALEMFGANIFAAGHGIEYTFVVLHLIGAALVAAALVMAVARFFRTDEFVIPVLALAIVFNLVAYMVSRQGLTIATTREIAPVMPFGAALAGRVLAGPALRARLVPILAVAGCGYLAALGYAATLPSLPGANTPLATWLTAHHLSEGLAEYWQANSTTLDTSGRILVSFAQVSNGRLVPGNWETRAQAYDPGRYDATFFAIKDSTATPGALAAAVSTFGSPLWTYHTTGYTILVWNTNVLRRLVSLSSSGLPTARILARAAGSILARAAGSRAAARAGSRPAGSRPF